MGKNQPGGGSGSRSPPGQADRDNSREHCSRTVTLVTACDSSAQKGNEFYFKYILLNGTRNPLTRTRFLGGSEIEYFRVHFAR